MTKANEMADALEEFPDNFKAEFQANFNEVATLIREQAAEIERLKKLNEPILSQIQHLILFDAIESIANNSCCEQCQEAKLVAAKALAEIKEANDEAG